MTESRGAGEHKTFVIAMVVLMVLLLAAAAAAWWMLEEVGTHLRGREAAAGATEHGAAGRGGAPRAGSLDIESFGVKLPDDGSFGVVLTRRRGEPTRVRVASGDLGTLDDATTLGRLDESARDALARSAPGSPGRRATIVNDRGVPTAEVVATVDALIHAGFTDVTFDGSPAPGTVPHAAPAAPGSPK